MQTNYNLENVKINNSLQWILVKGKNKDLPLLIHIQAGPGFPIIHEAGMMQQELDLESSFLVAYWDQRCCGKSFTPHADPHTITINQLRDDILACTKYLLRKYRKEKAVLCGYSIGATLSLMAASADSSLYSHLILAGTDIDIPSANTHALKFIEKTAIERKKIRWIEDLKALSELPITNARLFQKRAKLLSDSQGIRANKGYNSMLLQNIKNMLLSSAYSLSDITATIRGMEFCQNALLPEMDKLNLFELVHEVHVPVHFVHGKKDGISPYETACSYYNYIIAPYKIFSTFERSAHMPHLEEAKRFANLVKEFVTVKKNICSI